jgi:hypothetical protein
VPAKASYIILAHQRPDLLARLVGALGESPIAVHIDAKSDMSLGEIERRANVTLLPRRRCHWGLYDGLAVTVAALPWFLNSDSSHLIALSGQCYPLASQRAIGRRMAELGERSQIRAFPFPIEKWGEAGGYERITRHYFPSGRTRPRSLRLLPRRLPAGLHPHGGSAYWSLSRKHVAYIAEFLEKNPQVARFFRTTFAPDEMMFQTILANSPYAAEIVNQPTNYSTFKPNRANPEILQFDDLAAALGSGALFARKFEDHAVLDRLEEMLAPLPV